MNMAVGDPPLQFKQASGSEPAGEERQNLVTRGDGWLAGLIDQMLRHHAVRIRHTGREERRNIGVGVGVTGGGGVDPIP